MRLDPSNDVVIFVVAFEPGKLFVADGDGVRDVRLCAPVRTVRPRRLSALQCRQITLARLLCCHPLSYVLRVLILQKQSPTEALDTFFGNVLRKRHAGVVELRSGPFQQDLVLPKDTHSVGHIQMVYRVFYGTNQIRQLEQILSRRGQIEAARFAVAAVDGDPRDWFDTAFMQERRDGLPRVADENDRIFWDELRKRPEERRDVDVGAD